LFHSNRQREFLKSCNFHDKKIKIRVAYKNFPLEPNLPKFEYALFKNNVARIISLKLWNLKF